MDVPTPPPQRRPKENRKIRREFASTRAVVHWDRKPLQSWRRTTDDAEIHAKRFKKYAIEVDTPSYDEDTYEKHLTSSEWTKSESDYLIDVYRECNAKWPVIIDRYAFENGPDRTMEELKSRFYHIAAKVLSLQTPIKEMSGADFALYNTMAQFDPRQEASRKKLAEGHLYRRQNEVDEESVLLAELQRIMLNQANLDSEREVAEISSLLSLHLKLIA